MVRTSSAVVAALTALLATTDAWRHDPVARTLALDFHRSTQNVRPAGARLAKRAGKSVGEDISWGGLLYYINITLGTPGQPSAAWLDTGSSDLWLPNTGTDICSQQGACGDNGGFDPDKSSTYKTVARGAFSIQYASGDQIQGDYGQDTLSMDQATINDMIFGLADQGQTTTPLSGIMGIGYTLGESSVAEDAVYPNIVDKLVSSGIISTKLYSLYLNSLELGHGTILFGGIDKDKYTGELGIVSVQETEETQAFDTFTVVLASMSFTTGSETSNIDLGGPMAVILDSGTTMTYLPDDIAHSIYNGLGIEYDDYDGPFLPCNVKTDNMKFTFVFGSDRGVSIDVDLGQLVLPYDPADQLPTINGVQQCTFGLLPAGTVSNGQGDILFGDTFLRSAYVVYDLDNNQVAMAQTNFGSSDSNVEAVDGSGSASTNTIPGATTVANQVSAGQSAEPSDIGGVATGFNGPSGANAQPTSAQATFNGLNGGLQTGTTTPFGPGSSKSAAVTIAPQLQWENFGVLAVAAMGALVGGGWLMS